METKNLFFAVLFIFTFAFGMAGCGDGNDDPPPDQGSCADDGTCDDDTTDGDADDDDSTCTPMTEGCGCLAGGCNEGLFCNDDNPRRCEAYGDDDDDSVDDDDDTTDDDDDSTDDDDDSTDDDDDSVDAWKEDYLWIDQTRWRCTVDGVYDNFHCSAPTVEVEIRDWDEENHRPKVGGFKWGLYLSRREGQEIFDAISTTGNPPESGTWGTIDRAEGIAKLDWVDGTQEVIHFIFYKVE